MTSAQVSRNKYLNLDMEEIARNIFLASVNAVKPCELMTVNKLVQLHKDNGKSFIEIKCNGKIDRFEVTNKNLHLGERFHTDKKFL